MNSVRAIVRVSIDGKPLSDVSDGWFIIGANDTLDLERFVRNGNFQKGNSLKFIERTAQIEAHKGGIGIEDGLIRVEYKFEKVVQQQWLGGNYTTYGYNCNIQGGQTLGNVTNVVTTTTPSSTPYHETECSTYRGASDFTKSNSPLRGKATFTRSKGGPSGQSRGVQAQMNVNMASMEPLNDAGITVAGSESNQKFSWGSYFPTEDTSHVIVLKLVGKVEHTSGVNGVFIPVARPVTVKQKPTCSTCGKVGKATSKFCGRCGTALQLFG